MSTTTSLASAEPMGPHEFDELEDILDELRTRHDATPQWEFCEGFMAALVCCRRAVASDEYFPPLLGIGAGAPGSFADGAQAGRFMALWTRRWNEVRAALDDEAVESLDDPACYHPEVLDVRGAMLALPEAERADMAGELLPSFGQVWALGFLAAVEQWAEEWAPPRDKEDAAWLAESLAALEALTQDDRGAPELAPFDDADPPSVSTARIEDFGAAIWAVYDLRELWRSIGPRVETVRKAPEPGRNELCWCGSGKKYKKCHGAT